MLYLLVMLEQSLLLEVALHTWLVHELLMGVQAIVEGLEKQTVLESEQVFASILNHLPDSVFYKKLVSNCFIEVRDICIDIIVAC